MENPINNENLAPVKRGRPKKCEPSLKIWEDKNHVAQYNKIYYANRKQNEETIICPDCDKVIKL